MELSNRINVTTKPWVENQTRKQLLEWIHKTVNRWQVNIYRIHLKCVASVFSVVRFLPFHCFVPEGDDSDSDSDSNAEEVGWFWSRYCCWKKSCTKDDEHPIICRVLTIPGGAGFLQQYDNIGLLRNTTLDRNIFVEVAPRCRKNKGPLISTNSYLMAHSLLFELHYIMFSRCFTGKSIRFLSRIDIIRPMGMITCSIIFHCHLV